MQNATKKEVFLPIVTKTSNEVHKDMSQIVKEYVYVDEYETLLFLFLSIRIELDRINKLPQNS